MYKFLEVYLPMTVLTTVFAFGAMSKGLPPVAVTMFGGFSAFAGTITIALGASDLHEWWRSGGRGKCMPYWRDVCHHVARADRAWWFVTFAMFAGMAYWIWG